MWAEEAPDPSIVGDICHIAAKGDAGPRAISSLPDEVRDGYDNLLLLCKTHHKLIDDNPNTYTIDKLKEIKREHEAWVESTLTPQDKEQQRIKEQYAAILSEWEIQADIGSWDSWANEIVSWYPSIHKDRVRLFEELPHWVNTRWWPGRLPLLEAAFVNYSKWLRAVLSVLFQHTEELGDMYHTPKFYHIREWNKEKYDELYDVWLDHLKLLEKLMVELCKSGNLIARIVRAEVSAGYRHSEGKFALRDTFERSQSVFGSVYEYETSEVGDGLIFSRSSLYKEVTGGNG